MKILYCLADRNSSILTAKQALPHLHKHEVRFFGFSNQRKKLNLSWCGDLFYAPNGTNESYFKKQLNISGICRLPHLTESKFNLLLETVKIYNPDLILSDNNNLGNLIGHFGNIKTLDFSGMNAYNSLNYETRFYNGYLYYYFRNLNQFRPTNIAAYSPFYVLNNAFKEDLVWIKPYGINAPITNQEISHISNRAILNKWFKELNVPYGIGDRMFVSAETENITQAVELNKKLYLMPDFSDIETVCNTAILLLYYFAVNIGQTELMKKHGLNLIINLMNKSYPNIDYIQDIQKIPLTLDKYLETL